MATAHIDRIGVVLAGGKSSRMGCDKASLRINNESLLLRSRNTLMAAGCNRVILSGHSRPDWHWESIGDTSPYGGPAGGLASTILWAHEQHLDGTVLIFTPVDSPLISSSLLSDMSRVAIQGNGCAVTNHPLPAAVKVTPTAVELSRRVNLDIRNGRTCSMKHIHQQLDTIVFPINDAVSAQLVNTNTPSEWEELCHELENRA